MSATTTTGPGLLPEPVGPSWAAPHAPVGAPVPAGAVTLPEVLLLDEGGVLSVPGDGDGDVADVALRVAALIGRAGIPGPSPAQIETDIRCAKDSYRQFKARHLSDAHPPEIDHRTFWRDLVAASWPAPARTVVGLECDPLSDALSAASGRCPAPGAGELLAWATGRGIRVGLVANTFAAGTTRARLAAWGLDGYLSLQVHSAEFGYRKPDPRLLTTAMAALRADPARCWYAGDSRAKDVECGRRAGVATTVLVRPVQGPGRAQHRATHVPGPEADLQVRGCAGLREVLGRIADRGCDPHEEGANR